MRGDILFLAHRLPWPPDRGDRIRSWHMLRALAKLAPVHVIAPVDNAADLVHLPVVEQIAASVVAHPRPARIAAIARALRTGMPASVAAFVVPALERAVAERLAGGRIGTIFAFSSQMAHYVPHGTAARFVMDFVDMDSAKFATLGAKAWGLSGFALRAEAKRLFDWEVAIARRADASLFVSEAEASLFRDRTGVGAQVVENGVDADHFAPDRVAPTVAPHPLIVFTGQMDYAPNIEAVTQFAQATLPSIPGAHFAIVGRGPAPAVRALASEHVTVTGEVPDTRPWLTAADIVVAPLRLARGIQNKVLEAMAMARPVVVSAAAAEGIDALDGEQLVVADGAPAEAAAIAALLADPARAAAIGAAARTRVVECYGWDARLAPLAQLIA